MASHHHLVNDEPVHTSLACAPLPTRLRNWFALFAIFLGLIAQTVHTHPISGSVFRKAGFHAMEAANQSPDLCPVCIAMHTAQPATTPEALTPVLSCSSVLLPMTEQAVAFPPAFTHYCRPPPHSTR